MRAAYAGAVEYTLAAVVAFRKADAERDPVLVMLGDHRARAIVSGGIPATTCRCR